MDRHLYYVQTDACGCLFAAALILFIGHLAVGEYRRCRQIGAALGGVVLLVILWVVRIAKDITTLTVLSLVGSGLIIGSMWILLRIIAGIYGWVMGMWRRALANQERRRQRAHDAELKRAREEEPKHVAAPLPTRKEQLDILFQTTEEFCKLIEASPLSDTAKADIVQDELRALQKKIRNQNMP